MCVNKSNAPTPRVTKGTIGLVEIDGHDDEEKEV